MTPAVPVRAPGRSNPPARRLPSGVSTASAATAPTPVSGTFTKKTASQPSAPVRMPPSSAPRLSPAAPHTAHTVIARLRAGPSANMVTTRERVAGISTAPPSPCSALAQISGAGEEASPPSSEATPYSSMPATNMRRLPSRSDRRPPSSRKPPKGTA